MSTVATILPMSLLACLGSDAEAIREIFVHRLEAQTEDILLKIAIVKFFRLVTNAIFVVTDAEKMSDGRFMSIIALFRLLYCCR